MLVYLGICFEICCWFFVGECLGRRNFFGYIVPATYVSKAVKKEKSKIVIDDKTSF